MPQPRKVRLCPQLPPLIKKNFLVFFASQYFLIATLLAALAGLIFSIFLIHPSYGKSHSTLIDLFPTDSLNVGPSGLCNIDFHVNQHSPISLVVNQGILADQFAYNIESIQAKLTELGIEKSRQPMVNLVEQYDPDDLDFSPQIDNSVNSFLFHWTQVGGEVAVQLSDQNVHTQPFQSPHLTQSSQQHPQQQQQQQQQPQQQQPYSFDYKLISMGSNTGGWNLLHFPFFINPYDNSNHTLADINTAVYLTSLVELSIAQLNGFYSNTLVCDFPMSSFDLTVYPYPTTFTQANPLQEFNINLNLLLLLVTFSLFYLPASLFIVTAAVSEKNNHLYAAFLAIGLTSLNMHLATLITYLILFLPIIFIATFVAIGIVGISTAVILFFAFCGILLVFLCFTIFFSSLFNNLPIAQIGSLFTLLVLFAFGALSLHLNTKPRFIACLLYFPATITHLFTAMRWLYYRLGHSLNVLDIFYGEIPNYPMSIAYTILSLYIQSVIIFFLAVYFDSILPTSEHHTPKHWAYPVMDTLRFFARKCRCKTSFSRFAYSFGGSSHTHALSVDENGEERLNIMSLGQVTAEPEHSVSSKDSKPSSQTKTKKGKKKKDANVEGGETSTQKGGGKKKKALKTSSHTSESTISFSDLDQLDHLDSYNSLPYQNLSITDSAATLPIHNPMHSHSMNSTFSAAEPNLSTTDIYSQSKLISSNQTSTNGSPLITPSHHIGSSPPSNQFLFLTSSAQSQQSQHDSISHQSRSLTDSNHTSTSLSSISTSNTRSNPFSSISGSSSSHSSDSQNSNAFDFINTQSARRYFLQYGKNREDKLYEHEEYLFEGRSPESQEGYQNTGVYQGFSGNNNNNDNGNNNSDNFFTQHSYHHTPSSRHTNNNNKPAQESYGFFDSLSTTLVAGANFFDSQVNIFAGGNNKNSPKENGFQLTPLGDYHNSQISSDNQMMNGSPTQTTVDRPEADLPTSNSQPTQKTRHEPIIQFPTQTEQENPSITVKKLTKTFTSGFFGQDKVQALDDINLRLYRGQIHSIIGKNASGKSVLLSILGGFLEQTDGSVFLHMPNYRADASQTSDGQYNRYRTPLEEMMENPLTQYHETKKISQMQRQGKTEAEMYRPTYGICWQEDTLFEDLSCIQNLELFSLFKESVSGNHLTREQRFQEIYQFLDMAQLSSKFDGKENAIVASLSGGQRRKLNLAVALLHNPSIVLLDHCTNGADVSAQAVIWNMLEIQKKKRTIVLCTHSLSEALIGDRISILKEGQLVCSGSALFLKEHYNVGEYIFTIEKLPLITLDEDAFEHDFMKKHAQASLPPGFDEAPLPAITEDRGNGGDGEANADSNLPQTISPPGLFNTTRKTSSTTPTPNSDDDDDDDDGEVSPTLTVDLHKELMNTRIEQIGFNTRSMLRLISDSHLTLTYAIQPQHEANIPLLLDYIEQFKDRLWIRATSLTTTSLDDVFRRAHADEEYGEPNLNPDNNYTPNGSETEPENGAQLATSMSITSTTLPRPLKPVATKQVYLTPDGGASPTDAKRAKQGEFLSDGFSLDSLDSLDETPSSSENSAMTPGEAFFSGKEWYQLKLPRIENKFELFKSHFNAFFKKRLIMLFYHSLGIIPIVIIISLVLSTPTVLYALISKVSPPISLNYDQFHPSNSKLQYFAPKPAEPEPDDLNYPATQHKYDFITNDNDNDHDNTPSTTNGSDYDDLNYWSFNGLNAASQRFNVSSLTFDQSESILDWFSTAVTSSRSVESRKTELTEPIFNNAALSPNDIHTIIHAQSYSSSRVKPSFLSTILHNLAVKYNDQSYQIVGQSVFDDIPSQYTSKYGLISASSSLYANLTAPLTIPSYITQYYAHLTTLHVNLQNLIKPTAQLATRLTNEQPRQPHQSQPILAADTTDTTDTTNFSPQAPFEPIYHNTSHLLYRQSSYVRFSTLISAGTYALLSLLPIVVGMFFIYHHNFERSSKVYELHRLAGGNAMVAYHIANLCFDILASAVIIISTYLLITVAAYITLQYGDERLEYLSWKDNPRGYIYLAVYFIVVTIATPFQSYIAYYLSPTSLAFAYIIHIILSIFPILIEFAVKLGDNAKFLALMSPSSIFFFCIKHEWFQLWSASGPAGEFLTEFHPIFLAPGLYIGFGGLILMIYHRRFVTLGFNEFTGTLGSTFGHKFHAIRPYNRITKQDSTVLEMKRNIIAMRNKTGSQGRDQYALTLYGLRKVYHGPIGPYLFHYVVSFLNSIFNPLYHWWRSDQRYNTKEQRDVEKHKLRLLRKQRRQQQQRLKAKTQYGASFLGDANNSAQESSDDSNDDDDDNDDEPFQPFFSEPKSMRGATVALNDLFLSVRKNSVLCVVGTNGSGKSSCFNLLTNESNPSNSNDPLSTHIGFIENTNLITDPAAVFTKISYCPQGNRLNLQLTGKEHFELYATLYGIKKELHDSLIARIIHSLDLIDVAEKPCANCSPGQLRLIMIGISLLCNSEIVLLDEFSNFLDPISRSRVHRLLKSLIHTRTIILASHMAEEIEQLSDDIAIMSKGSLITVGSKSMLKAGETSNSMSQEHASKSLVYTVNIRVESVHVLISVQSFVISTLARIPPPKLGQSDSVTSIMSPVQRKVEAQGQIHAWNQWLKACKNAGVKLVDQRHNRFTLHVNTDLFPLSTLFTRLENCKLQCGTHFVRYTASQPTVDQLFISVIERSSQITNSNGEKVDFGDTVVI